MDPTAAPVDLKLNGKVFQAHPFRDMDHETFNKWVRREYMDRVKDSIDGDEYLQGVALSRVAMMTWMSGDGLRVAMTVAGMRKMACLMCRTEAITLDDVASEESLNEIYEVYRVHHPIPEDVEVVDSDKKDGGPDDPN